MPDLCCARRGPLILLMAMLGATLPLRLDQFALGQVAPASGRAAVESARSAPPRLDEMLGEAPGEPLVLPAPPGVDAARLAPHAPGEGRATLPLDEALTRLAPTNVFPPTRSVNPPTDQVLRDTTRLYLEAREMAIDGRFFDSIRTLEQALKLDPGSISCLRLLAENYLSTTGPAKALGLYETILAIDPDDVDALWRLGSAAWQRRDVPRAAAMLGRAYTLLSHPAPRGADRDVWCLATHNFGQVLLTEGYDEAGVGVWHELMQALPALPPQSPRYQREIDRLYRSAPEMWRDLGDAFCRLQRFDEAIEVYARAADSARLGDEAMLPRLIWALARSGRTNTAMGILIDAVDDPQQGRSGEMVSLFRGTTLGDRLIEALRHRLDEQPAELKYVKAIAALLEHDRGDAIILEYLAEHGADMEVARDLLPWTIERLAPSQSLRLIIGVAGRLGRVPDELIDELTALTDDPDRFTASWSELPPEVRLDPMAELVYIAMLMRAFRYEEAGAALDALIAANPALVDARLRRVGMLIVLNLTDAASELLDGANPGPDDPLDATYHKALLLAQAGRIEEALHAIERLASDRPDDIDRVEHLRRKAGLLVSIGRHADAATALNGALEIDPRSDSVYALLMRLYGFSGPVRDNARLGEIVGLLLANAPQGRTARMLRAEQDALRGRFDDAIATYQTLVSEDPADDAALDGLVKIWLAAGRAAEAADWLAAARQSRPGDRRLRDAWLRALVADHRGNEVIDLLRAAIARRPYDIDSYRRLEEVLKAVGREEESLQVMRQRWSQMPPSVARSLALAELDVQAEQGPAALVHLHEALKQADDHLSRHLESIMVMATRVASVGPQDEAMELVRATGERVIAQRVAAPSSVYLAYAVALVELDLPLDEILGAIDRAKAVNPSIELEMTALATISLVRRERPDDACLLVDRWLGEERPLGADEAGLVERRILLSVIRNEPQRTIDLTRRAFAGEAHTRMRILNVQPVPSRKQYDPLADSLYLLSGEFSSRGFTASHELLLEEALKVDDSHPAANNDLGYSLADRGERLEEAEAMLVKAIKAEPSNSAYLDSLGWVRYKLGRLEHLDDEPRDLHEYAAIPLLEDAVFLRKSEGRPDIDTVVIFDHLGDAYWRAGRTADAINTWERAAETLDEYVQMAQQNASDEASAAAEIELYKEHYGPTVQSARSKMESARAGQAPPVAPSPALDEPHP